MMASTMRRALSIIGFVLLTAGSAAADEPLAFLSWHAPYGSPGAADTLTLSCEGPAKPDTLYLSFDPGETNLGFTGFTAEMRIRSLDGDSLSGMWRSSTYTGLPRWMRVEFAPDSTSGCPSPFEVQGFGMAGFRRDRDPDGAGIIRMVHAVAYPDSATVKGGHRYGLARFLFRPPSNADGCRRPVCIDWSWINLASAGGRETKITESRSRVVANPAPGIDCSARPVGKPAAKPASGPKAKPWKPK